MPPPRVEVVHVGSAARDIAPDDPRGWRLGGGVTYAALTTARLGLRTAAVVGVDGEAAEAHELDALRDAGVDVLAVDLPEGPIFHNVETPRGRRADGRSRPGVPVRPVPLPVVVAEPAGRGRWSRSPTRSHDDWAEVIASGRDRRGRVAGHAPPARGRRRSSSACRRADRAILRRADLVGLSHLDVARDTSLGDLSRFLHRGARLLVTQGGHGGLLVTTGDDGPAEVLRYLPTPTEREVDPTGAGDTFLAALLAVLVRPSVAGSPGRVARPGTPLRGCGRLARRRGRRPGRRPGSHRPCSSGARANGSAARSCRPCRPRSASRIRGSRGAAVSRRPAWPAPGPARGR